MTRDLHEAGARRREGEGRVSLAPSWFWISAGKALLPLQTLLTNGWFEGTVEGLELPIRLGPEARK